MTEIMSVFPVAFSGGLAFEGPVCENGKAVDWQAVWQSKERYCVHVSTLRWCTCFVQYCLYDFTNLTTVRPTCILKC